MIRVQQKLELGRKTKNYFEGNDFTSCWCCCMGGTELLLAGDIIQLLERFFDSESEL